MKRTYTFREPDPRFVTRHTPNPDLPAQQDGQRIRNGRLSMRLAEREGQIYTTHLATTESFRFGVFEARMRFWGPKGAHSAFWLQDVHPDRVGGSEVDIIEHFGSDHTLWSNVYWRTEVPDTMWPKEPNRWRMSTRAVNPRAWNTYGLIWRPDIYMFTVNGAVHSTCAVGVSESPKVIILSLLSSRWEWPKLQRDNLSAYITLVDWVKYTSLERYR